jgi:hypothetical protein
VLTLKEIEELLSEGGSTTDKPAQWFDGFIWHSTPVPTGMASGSYRGKAGSIRRSNKGRSRRMPNGSRRYLIDYDSTVVAYKV